MTQNSLATSFPQGIQTPNVSGLNYLALERGITIDTTSKALVAQRKDNEYKFVVDEGNSLNGIYVIDLVLNKKRFNAIVSVSAQTLSTDISAENIDNSVNILSSLNEDPSIFKLQELTLFTRTSNTSLALVMVLSAISGIYDDMTVEITALSSKGRLSSSLNHSLYTIPLAQRKYGYSNAIEVKSDSSGVNIDLNDIIYSSISSCNPATPGSRPNADGIGVCYTISGTANTSSGAQLFIDNNNDMYYRTRVNGVYGFWEQVYTSNHYPRIVAGGVTQLTLNKTNSVNVTVPGIDLTQKRFIISPTPEKITEDCSWIQVSGRQNGSFGLLAKGTTQDTWTGKVNWVVYESKPKTIDTTLTIRTGILQGEVFTDSNVIAEGQTLRIIVSATNLPEGKALAYNLTQISQADIVADMSGFLSIQNGIGILDIPIVQDFLPESTETLRFTLAETNTFKDVSISDVSGAPEYNCKMTRFSDGKTPITQANEGDTVYLALESKYVANGTSFTFSCSSPSDLDEYVTFSAPRNINNNLIVVPVKIEADASKAYEGSETLSFNVLLSGIVVASTQLVVVDTAWKAECWYSSLANGTNSITQANEGDTVYFNLRVPSGTAIGTYFKPRLKTVGTTGNILEGDDVDITNSTIVAHQYISSIILSQKIEIRADRKTEGDELLYMEWVNQITSNVVADSNKPLLIKDTSLTPVQNIYLSDVSLQNVDLKTLFENQFGTQDVPWVCNLYMSGEVWIKSNSVSLPAMTSDNWIAGTVVNVYWNAVGGLVGKGGKGADPKIAFIGENGGSAIKVGSGHTLNMFIHSGDAIVSSGGGGGGGVTINGKYVGGGGGADTGLPGVGDYVGTSAGLITGGQGGSYTDTATSTTFVGGNGGDLGLSGSVSPSVGVNTPAGTYGNIKTGSGTLVIKKNDVLVTTSQYYNSNSFIRGGW